MGRLLSATLSLLLLTSALLSAGCGKKTCECLKFCEQSQIGCVVTDLDGRITFANPAYLELLGFTMDELKGRTYQQLTPEKWHETEKAYIDAAAQLPFVRFEKEYARKDGTVIPIEVTGWMIRDENGRPAGTASFVIDMTDYMNDQNLEQMILP